MPPKGKKQRKRPATASADGPSSQRSRRSSTINATMATRSANQPPSVNTAPTVSVPPVTDAVSTETVLPPELLQTLVSTVTAEYDFYGVYDQIVSKGDYLGCAMG
ncbi:Hypothetical predicted protein [Paramuricea clavata]|uniref:Uncharacterized protein n=1 Tax=Paramuricea clavata TaxID=317549 RepID=A0A6S7HSJ0_PARCT|nr:Hypothetical predicted protein [Paramuricea clavata]